MAAMLSRLGGRGYKVQDDPAIYGVDFDPDFDLDFDCDPDPDFDFDLDG